VAPNNANLLLPKGIYSDRDSIARRMAITPSTARRHQFSSLSQYVLRVAEVVRSDVRSFISERDNVLHGFQNYRAAFRRTSHGAVQWVDQISSDTGLCSTDAYNLATDRSACRAVATTRKDHIYLSIVILSCQ